MPFGSVYDFGKKYVHVQSQTNVTVKTEIQLRSPDDWQFPVSEVFKDLESLLQQRTWIDCDGHLRLLVCLTIENAYHGQTDLGSIVNCLGSMLQQSQVPHYTYLVSFCDAYALPDLVSVVL